MESTDNLTKPALLYHDGDETMNDFHQKARIVAKGVASGDLHESATTDEL
ncbi:hypothetical protein [Coleofasciculus sp.]